MQEWPKTTAHMHTFFSGAAERRACADGGQHSARKAAGDARAGRPSHPNIAASRCAACATLHAALQLHVAALLLHSDPREPQQMQEENRNRRKTSRRPQRRRRQPLRRWWRRLRSSQRRCAATSRAQGSCEWAAGAGTPVPGAHTCRHMLAIRHAPEAALRRSRLHAQVVQLSLLVAAFRADALRMHSRVERRRMSERALAHCVNIRGDREKL